LLTHSAAMFPFRFRRMHFPEANLIGGAEQANASLPFCVVVPPVRCSSFHSGIRKRLPYPPAENQPGAYFMKDCRRQIITVSLRERCTVANCTYSLRGRGTTTH
jgi:hypothetical protein